MKMERGARILWGFILLLIFLPSPLVFGMAPEDDSFEDDEEEQEEPQEELVQTPPVPVLSEDGKEILDEDNPVGLQSSGEYPAPPSQSFQSSQPTQAPLVEDTKKNLSHRSAPLPEAHSRWYWYLNSSDQKKDHPSK